MPTEVSTLDTARTARAPRMVEVDLEAAWAAVHHATPSGWSVGRPSYHDERHEWVMYAFDSLERPRAGARSREWTAIGATEVACLREMARCLREIDADQVPL
jgi:hypothetical protein